MALYSSFVSRFMSYDKLKEVIIGRDKAMVLGGGDHQLVHLRLVTHKMALPSIAAQLTPEGHHFARRSSFTQLAPCHARMSWRSNQKAMQKILRRLTRNRKLFVNCAAANVAA